MEYADISEDDVVVDAYAGVGTIGIIASPYAKEVISVELNKDAVRDAKINASINGVKNIRFFCADATEFLLEAAIEIVKIDVVLMDPPRAGSTVQFMKSVCTLAPEKVVYVSCNPETLARDLTYFAKNGYKVKKIQPVDMFPHTNLVETVALLSRQKINEDIHVDVDVAILPKTIRTTATYPEIKAYIKEKYGLCVSSLNIAQVKEKHGLEKRENYNKGKEDHRVPN